MCNKYTHISEYIRMSAIKANTKTTYTTPTLRFWFRTRSCNWNKWAHIRDYQKSVNLSTSCNYYAIAYRVYGTRFKTFPSIYLGFLSEKHPFVCSFISNSILQVNKISSKYFSNIWTLLFVIIVCNYSKI